MLAISTSCMSDEPGFLDTDPNELEIGEQQFRAMGSLRLESPTGEALPDAQVEIDGVVHVVSSGVVALDELDVDVDAEIRVSAPGFVAMHIELDEALLPDEEQTVTLMPKPASR